MWRACRLVVDTGMHAFGWTRQQSLDFMTQNTALLSTRSAPRWTASSHGRAGLLPTRRVSSRSGAAKRAEAELGPRFDVRAFHDAVLGQGGVTPPVLGQADRRLYRAHARPVNGRGEYGRLLGSNGPLARVIEGFQSRREQQLMADWVGETLAHPRHARDRGRHGHRQDLRYLVPALLSGRQVIISTGTRTLGPALQP
jgi:hypothetical protein